MDYWEQAGETKQMITHKGKMIGSFTTKENAKLASLSVEMYDLLTQIDKKEYTSELKGRVGALLLWINGVK